MPFPLSAPFSLLQRALTTYGGIPNPRPPPSTASIFSAGVLTTTASGFDPGVVRAGLHARY